QLLQRFERRMAAGRRPLPSHDCLRAALLELLKHRLELLGRALEGDVLGRALHHRKHLIVRAVHHEREAELLLLVEALQAYLWRHSDRILQSDFHLLSPVPRTPATLACEATMAARGTFLCPVITDLLG